MRSKGPHQVNLQSVALRHIIIKFSKVKDRIFFFLTKRILKPVRKEQLITYKDNSIIMNFSTETL